MNQPNKNLSHYAIVIILLATPLPGCFVETPEDLLNAVNGTDAAQPAGTDPAGDPPPAETVRVRFRNLTEAEAVDVEFHILTIAPETLPDDLFDPENVLTASIGVAGTGILQPLTTDVVDLPCTPGLTLGTLGGRFLDNETGEERGRGQPRWAQDGPLAICGSRVTFDFRYDGNAFTTDLRIGS